MTVPTFDEFEDFVLQCRRSHAIDVADEIVNELPTDRQRLTDLVMECFLVRANRASELTEGHVVHKWFESQAAYLRAEEKAFPSKRKRNDDPTSHVQVVCNRLEKLILSHRRSEREQSIGRDSNLHRYVRLTFGMYFVFQWRLRLIKALQEYFYDDSAPSIARCHKELPGAIENAKRCISELVKELEGKYSSHPEILDLGHILHPLQKALQSIDLYYFPGIEKLFPLARENATMRERLFVYRMCIAHHTLFRVARPESIIHMLDMEGFRHSLDLRGVQRLCSSVVYTQNEIRQLKSKIRKETAASRNEEKSAP